MAHLAGGRVVFEVPSDRAASPHAGLTAVGLVDAGRIRWKVGAQDVLASDAPTQPRSVEYPRLMGATYDGLGPVGGLGTFRGQPKLHLRLEVEVEVEVEVKVKVFEVWVYVWVWVGIYV